MDKACNACMELDVAIASRFYGPGTMSDKLNERRS